MPHRPAHPMPHVPLPRPAFGTTPRRALVGGMRRHDRCFRGTPDQVGAVRRFVRSAIGGDHPCCDEALLLSSETATNALLYTASGEDEETGTTGTFTVEVLHSRRWVRVQVRDGGGATLPCVCHAGLGSVGGRGVALVDTVAQRWGFTRDRVGTCVWFELRAAGTS